MRDPEVRAYFTAEQLAATKATAKQQWAEAER
jgi:hypothetical protein